MIDHASGSILVTGAAGFVGQHVVAKLLTRGRQVVAIEHRRPMPEELRSRCQHVLTADLCDKGTQREALRDVHAICHLAAYIPPGMDDLSSAALCYRINAEMTLELATGAAANGVQRFVHLSTGNMYASSATPCIESESVFPSGHGTGYFASKFAAELYLTHLGRITGMQTVILRIGTPYGPGEPANKVVPTFLRLAHQRQALRLVNGGCARLNFVHVSDVADCIVEAVETGPDGIYNVASGEHTSLLQLADSIVTLFGGCEVPLHVEPPTSDAFPGFPPVSIDKAIRTWNYAPRSLAQGLSDYYSVLAKGAFRT